MDIRRLWDQILPIEFGRLDYYKYVVLDADRTIAVRWNVKEIRIPVLDTLRFVAGFVPRIPKFGYKTLKV